MLSESRCRLSWLSGQLTGFGRSYLDIMNPEAYRAIVFNSARDGNLRRLRIFLEERSHNWLDHCLSSRNLQTPPLVIAARNGHFDVVKYLVVPYA